MNLIITNGHLGIGAFDYPFNYKKDADLKSCNKLVVVISCLNDLNNKKYDTIHYNKLYVINNIGKDDQNTIGVIQHVFGKKCRILNKRQNTWEGIFNMIDKNAQDLKNMRWKFALITGLITFLVSFLIISIIFGIYYKMQNGNLLAENIQLKELSTNLQNEHSRIVSILSGSLRTFSKN